LGFDAERAKVSQGGVEEGDRALLAFVRHDARVSESGGIINRDVDVFVAGAAGVIALAVAGDAVADALDAGEFLDVEVDELTRVLAAITNDGRRGIEEGEAMELVGAEEA
jgi:hypothetical protein